MNPRDDVILTYGDLFDGDIRSGQLCPKCRGGSSGERAMSVGRSDGLLWWQCHRASCGFKGADGFRGSGKSGDSFPSKDGTSRGSYKASPMSDGLRTALAKKYHVPVDVFEQAGWRSTPSYSRMGRFGPIDYGRRVLMPILSPSGAYRGIQFRSFWNDEPKALIESYSEEQCICWYKFRKYAKVCVIVEDQPSALRVAASGHADAVALVGTTLNLERVLEIRDQEYSRIWLSLDADAYALAIKYVQEFSNYLPGLMIKPIDVDIKDMSPEMFELYITEALQI